MVLPDLDILLTQVGLEIINDTWYGASDQKASPKLH